MTGFRRAGWLVVASLVSAAVLAHHSISGQFDTRTTFEITGVVTRVDWVNPHTQVYVEVEHADGTTLVHKLESHPVAMMRKAGVSKSDLIGDGRPVTATAHPARNGDSTLGYLLFMRLADGREIQFSRVPGAEKP